MRKFVTLDIDDVVTLTEMTSDPLKLFVNGSLFGYANLVILDEEWGIEVISVVKSKPAIRVAA